MERYFIFLLVSLSSSFSFLFGQTVGFHTDSQGRLLDDNGNEFIMKGVNTPLTWFPSDVVNSIDDMRANMGVNALRIVVTDGYRWSATPENTWKVAVDRCIANDIIPILEVHDYTGYTDVNHPNYAAQWFVQHAAYFNQPEIKKHILLNIANEWGDFYDARNDADNPNGSKWLSAYRTAVSTIRNAGITTTLIIDATGYGQDIYEAKNIRDDGPALMSHDAGLLGGDPNLMFSLHMYCQWATTGEHQDDPAIVGAIKDMGIPILVGEFGYQHSESGGTCDINESSIINVCETEGVGWLAWSQKGNTGSVYYLDLCNDWSCTNLTGWGNTVVNSTNGSKSGQTCSVFLSSNAAPSVAITSPNTGSSFEQPTTIVIETSASDVDGNVSQVEFFDGNVSLRIDNTAPYSFSFVNPAIGNYTITAVATDDDGATTVSSPVAIAVTGVQCSTPDLGDDQFICSSSSMVLDANLVDASSSFSWERDGQAIAGASSALEIVTPGTYSVTVSKSGCAPATDDITVSSADIVAQDMLLCESGFTDIYVDGGTGGDINWYLSAGTSNAFYTGDVYSGEINRNSIFYVQEQATVGGLSYQSIGQQTQNSGSTIWDINDFDTDDKQVEITVTSDITLDAISVYPTNGGTSVTIRVTRASDGSFIGSSTETFNTTAKQRIALDIDLTPGTYVLDAVGTTDKLAYDATSGSFPYEIPGMLSITGNAPWVVTQGRYGAFYDWEFSYGDLVQVPVCDRVAIAITIDPNDPLCTLSAVGAGSSEPVIQVFPNPTSDWVEIAGGYSGSWSLYDARGLIVNKGEGTNVSMEDLPSGVYQLFLQDQWVRVIKN